MAYSKSQLEALWVAAGGNPAAANMAAAIALAESGGNPQSTDYDSDGSVDRGLWQINSVHGVQSTYNIAANARAAISISNNGRDWSPWVTYQNGAYRQFLAGGENTSFLGKALSPESFLFGPAAPLIDGGKALLEGDTPSIPNPLSGVEGAFGQLGKIPGDFDKIYHLLFTPEGWIRIGKVLVGLFLLLSGVLGMANIEAAETVVKHGKKVAELAAVAE